MSSGPPDDCRVFPVTLGVSVDDLGCGCLDALRSEQFAEPRIHVGEQTVFAHGQTPRVVVHGRRVVATDLATVEGVPPDEVALELLAAAVADHQAPKRVARRFGPAHSAVGSALSGCDGFGAGVGGDERSHPVPCRLVHNGLVRLNRSRDPLGPVLPALAGHVTEGRGIRIE